MSRDSTQDGDISPAGVSTMRAAGFPKAELAATLLLGSLAIAAATESKVGWVPDWLGNVLKVLAVGALGDFVLALLRRPRSGLLRALLRAAWHALRDLTLPVFSRSGIAKAWPQRGDIDEAAWHRLLSRPGARQIDAMGQALTRLVTNKDLAGVLRNQLIGGSKIRFLLLSLTPGGSSQQLHEVDRGLEEDLPRNIAMSLQALATMRVDLDQQARARLRVRVIDLRRSNRHVAYRKAGRSDA